MLKQRILTALILIPMVLAILFYMPAPAFCVLTGFITLGAAWEWTNLMQLTKTSQRFIYLATVTAGFLGAFFIPLEFLFAIAFAWWVCAFVLVTIYPRMTNWWRSSIFWRGLMGMMVLVPCWAAINYIRNQSDGIYSLLFLFILIWGADSGAYFVGKKWGKNKLAPRVSPGKSIQGAIAALFFSFLFTLIALIICHIPLHLWFCCILLSLITISFSIVGDLFESMLKRQVGLKDSGQLLPGHGGLLDRIDSLTAAAPVFAFGAIVLGQYCS